MDSDAKLYKLIGAVLVKQDLEEGKANVDKRIEYITAEMLVSTDFFLIVFDIVSLELPKEWNGVKSKEKVETLCD